MAQNKGRGMEKILNVRDKGEGKISGGSVCVCMFQFRNYTSLQFSYSYIYIYAI